jgi:RHS repeat-associated protein
MKHQGYNPGTGHILFHKGLAQLMVTDDLDLGYKYKYNGKELQDELGLDLYDYGTRVYMLDIVVRWRQIDPPAEMYSDMSPYNFVGANPIQNLEIDGRWWFSKSSNNNTIRNGPNKVKISGASQYAFKMSSVRSVHKKQTGVAAYIPVIGNWLNGSAMAQKAEDPTMKLDKGCGISCFRRIF